MFAQLLGMGRGKKEKEKELDDPSDHDPCSELVDDSEGEEDSLPNGMYQSGKHAASQRDTAASPTGIPVPVAPASHPNGGCAQHATTTDAPPTYDCLGGKVSNGASPASLGGAQAVGRSIAPAPPAGPAGFSSPAATPTLAIPLDRRAFAVEVAAVERGLHIQLGQAGAKTEAQLGDQQLEAAKRLRHLLVTNRAKIIQELLSRGWVPLLLRWLGLVHRPNLQVETLSALTTVAQNTTEHTPLLLKHGAVGTLVSLLKSPSLEMVEQAMWVLGKMAQDGQDGTTARDAVLQAGVLGPLVRCLEQHPTLLSLQRIGAWSLFNLLDGQPRPTVDVATVNTVMPAINRLLRSGDSEVLSHACSALSHLCDGSSAHIKIVVDSGVCKRLVQLLDHPSSQVVKPALRTIGNVVCAEDDADYTEAILEAGSVDCLKRLIAHPNREIQKEACWTLSNIAAGSVSQIQSVLDSGAMPQLIKLARSADTESEVRSEAYWVVLNAASCGSDAQIEYLVSEGCVQILSDLLGESSMVMMALEGIERVLSVGDLRVVRNAIASHSHADKGAGGSEDHCIECASAAAAAGGGGRDGGGLGGDPGGYMNPYACMLAPEKIQALEAHKDAAVAKRSNRIWARYFVTCAICRRSFNRHGRCATFCDECMCHVCRSCDCTVFHLAYQDKLWEEMEGKEKKGKQAQQAAKKSKKAKKREKKKNAAKESVVEPSKDNKSAGVDGAGTESKAAASGVKRAEGGEKDKAAGVTVERSKALGRKAQPHRRSPSPHKTSSSASTESNSEDEYTPPPPPNAYTATPAAAIINATAIAVTAAAAKHANQKRQKAAALQQAAASSPTTPKPEATVAASANGTSKVQEEQQRGHGKKQGRRDRGQQPTPGESAPKDADPRGGSPPASAAENPTSVRSDSNGKSEKASDDDNEEPWVVVGSKGGPQAAGAVAGKSRGGGGTGAWGAAGAKQSKGGKGQRAGEPGPGASTPSATLPGGGGGASVVGWASESSPAATARAVTARPKAVSPSPAGAVPRVSPPPLAVAAASVVPTAPPGSGRSASGNAWGIGSGGPKPPQPMASGILSPALAANGLRSATGGVNSPQVAVQRRGPTPGSGWGASLPTADARPKPLSAAVAPPGAILGQMSRAPGPTNRAGVIGPPSQAAAGGRLASSASKPVGSPTLPCARNAPLAASASISAPSASSLGGGEAGGGDVGVGNVVSGRSAIPAQQGLAGRSTANGQLVRSSSVTGDGEALVENEKLVSFLMETGSILALAQRLEEEEEWRRAAPSPASSGRG